MASKSESFPTSRAAVSCDTAANDVITRLECIQVARIRDIKANDGRTLLHVIAWVLARDAPHHLRDLEALSPALARAARCEGAAYDDVVDFAQFWYPVLVVVCVCV